MLSGVGVFLVFNITCAWRVLFFFKCGVQSVSLSMCSAVDSAHVVHCDIQEYQEYNAFFNTMHLLFVLDEICIFPG